MNKSKWIFDISNTCENNENLGRVLRGNYKNHPLILLVGAARDSLKIKVDCLYVVKFQVPTNP